MLRWDYYLEGEQMQEKEFIALLKSTVRENRLDLIPDDDLIKICGWTRGISDSIRIMDLELSDAIHTLMTEMKKRGLPQDDDPSTGTEKKATPKKTVNRKKYAKISAVLIGLGVLSVAFSNLLPVINKPRPDVLLDLPTSTFNMIIGGGFGLLGTILILVGIVSGILIGIVFCFRVIYYKIKKPSSISESNEPDVVLENSRHSSKKKILKWSCIISTYCVVISILPKIMHGYGAGNIDIGGIYLWMIFMGLAVVLSFISALCGIVLGIYEIYKSAYGISKNVKNIQDDSTVSTALSIICCFVPALVILLFIYINSDLLILFGHYGR